MNCEICKGQGLTGWEKPMGFPPVMVFVPQFCQCPAGRSLAELNAPDAKRTIISSIPGFEQQETASLKKIPNPQMAFSEPCGCGTAAGDPCPHTPIRCPHRWWYGKNPASLHDAVPEDQKIGGQRECEYCGRVVKAELSWQTVVA